MNSLLISRDQVIESSTSLPKFPPIVTALLATLDDPDFNLKELTACIEHDPVIAARVISLANSSLQVTRDSGGSINNIYTAVSLIGIRNVRRLALSFSIAVFAKKMMLEDMKQFWHHSVSVGVCCEEISMQTDLKLSTDSALIAGLMHDLGQLWLYHVNAADFREIWHQSLCHGIGIECAERERFGVDHATIGSWLAEHWQLSPDICNAICYHHEPDRAPDEPLVQVLHVAEVISNALDLPGLDKNRVNYLSENSCRKLGLIWDGRVQPMFGRIDARSRHAIRMFQ